MIEMICRNCLIDKLEVEFSYRNKSKNIKHKYCKNCVRQKTKVHYENNKVDYMRRARAGDLKNRARFLEFYRSLKTECILCKENWREALDFHHIVPSQKEFVIGAVCSKKKLIQECKKCIVLCANCHRKYHSNHPDTVALIGQLVESAASNPV